MMNLFDLKEIAKRQQEHIETQQRLIMAKEQRLKYLKQQSSTHQLHEQEKKRQRLKESVSLQEMKLRRLKALRGQFHQLQAANGTSSAELESIRALFSEKEKELSVALAKVDALTRQLEELKNGNTTNSYHINGISNTGGKHNLELEKLRQELLYRSKLCEQHNSEILQEKNLMMQKQTELSSIDQRINELQQRLARKRLLNQHLSSQMHPQLTRSDAHFLIDNALHSNSHLLRGSTGAATCRKMRPVSANIAAVEPLQRQPQYTCPESQESNHGYHDFTACKQDPKYQTLPHNTKFTAKQSYQWSHGISSSSVESTESRKEPPVELDESTKLMPTDVNRQRHSTGGNEQRSVVTGGPSINDRPSPSGSSSSSDSLNSSSKKNDTGTNHSRVPQEPPHKSSSENQNTANSPAHSNSNHHAHLKESSLNRKVSSGQLAKAAAEQQPNMASDARVPNTSGHNNRSLNSRINLVSKAVPITSNAIPNSNKPSLPPKPSVPVKPVPPPRQTPNPSNSQNDNESPKTLDAVDNAILLLKGNLSYNNGPVNSTRYPATSSYTDYGVRRGFVSKSVQQLQNLKMTKDNQPSTKQDRISSGTEAAESASVSVPENAFSEIPKSNDCSTDKLPSPKDDLNQCTENVQSQVTSSSLTPKGDNKASDDLLPSAGENHLKEDWHKVKRRPVVVGGEMEDALEAEIISALDSHIPAPEVNVIATLAEPIEVKDVEYWNTSMDISSSEKDEALKDDGSCAASSAGETVTSNGRKSPPVIESADANTSKEQTQTNGKTTAEELSENPPSNFGGVRRTKSNLKNKQKVGERITRRVSFDPLALLLDAALEGELELVKKTAPEISNPSSANDEGITALHNAICARHFDVVKYLIEIGCDVNLPDSDGWTPLHCAASCNSLSMVKFLVEHGACIFATTISDQETAPEKCEEDEEGYEECTQYLYGVQDKLGFLNGGAVYAVYDYDAQNPDELSFKDGDRISVLRKGDEQEREWWWSRLKDKEGYVPRNLLGLYPRIRANREQSNNQLLSVETK